jgi:hypothetical protein
MRTEYKLGAGRANALAKRIGAEGGAALLRRYLKAEHFVKLDDDVAVAFRDDASVNEALRLVLQTKAIPIRAPVAPGRRKRTGR